MDPEMAFLKHVHQWANSQCTWKKSLCVVVVCQVKIGPNSNNQKTSLRVHLIRMKFVLFVLCTKYEVQKVQWVLPRPHKMKF